MARSAEYEFGKAPLPLLCAEDELPLIAVENGIDLASYVSSLAAEWDGQYRFSPEMVLECGRLTIKGILACAGEYRDRLMIAGSYVPPNWKKVPQLVQEMCEYLNGMSDPFDAAAYVLWRLNWIHPFYDGNGRVARELCYLALLVGHGEVELPGQTVIPDLIDGSFRSEYFEGLRAADRAWTQRLEPDTHVLRDLLFDLLLRQYESGG